MDNSTRRQLLDRAKTTGYPGSILDAFAAHDQGRDLIGEFVEKQQLAGMQPPMQVAETPEEQGQGLRPYHERGQTDQSMAFPNVQPGQSFNTMGMKVPINIDKVDKQGNLVESYKAVPPGIANLPTGPYEGTVIESPARMQTGGINKYQTGSEKEEEDKRTLESGTIVDKGTNTLNIVKDGKITKTFPVLTGQAGKNPKTDVNKNVGSLDDLETNYAARSTPTGTYMMAPNPNIYGWPGYDLNPIAAFGQSAPAAEETAVHITYGANPKPDSTFEGHPDPAEFKRRNAAYKKDSSMRYLSYGCTNAQGEAINCLEQTFPQGDTAIYVDSRFNRDSSFLNRFRNQETLTPEVIEEPMIFEYPKSKPIDYKFDPEFGTVITNPIEVKPKEDRSKFKSKAKKKETGGISTTAETAMYEWKSGLPEDSRKRYIIGGLKNRVLYNKAKYKR
jgi:uncharacterized membrane protein (UPF0127 family)